MTEAKCISSLFENLYDGHPWIDVTIVDVLSKITAEQAAKRVGNCNSIWEIINHVIEWRLNVLKRVQGQTIKTPSNNYVSEVQDQSRQAWENTMKKLENSQKLWVDFLKQVKKDEFEKIYPVNTMTYYEHIHGIIQHDAYHLGQIALLAKLS